VLLLLLLLLLLMSCAAVALLRQGKPEAAKQQYDLGLQLLEQSARDSTGASEQADPRLVDVVQQLAAAHAWL
jgi:hypothetical protein